MGNLLGAPVTEKETHEGSSSSDNSMLFAVSSMQGWRVHMEDAHIMEPNLYALQIIPPSAAQQQQQQQQVVIELPGHALFAVFDGHGGTFAAMYAGRNLCRVLSRQPKFVQYAEFEQTRPEKERQLTTSSEKSNLARIGLELLEAALCDAFVDLDREIAQALKGVKVPEADHPYHPHNHHHHRTPSLSSTSIAVTTATVSTTTTLSATTTTTTSMMQGVVVEEGSVTATSTTLSSTRPLVVENGGVTNKDVDDDDEDDDDAGGATAPQDEQDEDDDDLASPSDSALQLLEEEGDSGTTACVVLVTPTHVLCANAGDSRAVISRLGHKAVPLSYDHKPDDEGEERRIRAAGGYVAGGRVEGDLAVSRGLGDFRFKNMSTVMAATSVFRYGEPPTTPAGPDSHQGASSSGGGGAPQSSSSSSTSWTSSIGSLRLPQGLGTAAHNNNNNNNNPAAPPLMKPGDQKVSPIPDVVIQGRNRLQDEFILVACDGIWDVLTNYEAVQTIAELFNEGETSLGLICEELCDLCLSMGSKDNMTALVVKFPAQISGTGGGVIARRQLRDEALNKSNNPSGNSNSNKGDHRSYGNALS